VCAANFIGAKNHSSLFRVHGEPTIEKVNALRDVLRSAGLTLEGGNKPHPMDYAKLIQAIKNRPDAGMLQTVILRSMQQAVYQPENLGHFGLSYPAYTHFTSPIRRYPDLLVHRVIKAILAKKHYKPQIPEDVPLNLTIFQPHGTRRHSRLFAGLYFSPVFNRLACRQTRGGRTAKYRK
jgi:ribonuclease R